jgi:malonyl-CoA O-methyltransferase
VLEHPHDLGGFFREGRRILKAGGRAVISAMHPAMFLRGSQARFTDLESGRIVQPGSLNRAFGDFVMAAVGAGFRIDQIGEHAPNAAFAASYPRAEKYIDYPMLVVLGLVADAGG